MSCATDDLYRNLSPGRLSSVMPGEEVPPVFDHTAASREMSLKGQSRRKQFVAQARVCPLRPRSRSGINELREERSMLVIHSNGGE